MTLWLNLLMDNRKLGLQLTPRMHQMKLGIWKDEVLESHLYAGWKHKKSLELFTKTHKIFLYTNFIRADSIQMQVSWRKIFIV